MSSSNRCECSRRSFVKSLATVLPAGLVVLPLGRAYAQASATTAKHVSSSEPLAASLGYTENASTVDKAKYPTYKPGQKCGACRFFQGATGEQYGPCQIFGGEAVNVNGWCASFNAKS